jgi:hypothetical protein
VIDPTLGLAPFAIEPRIVVPIKIIAPHFASDRTRVMLLRMFCTF